MIVWTQSLRRGMVFHHPRPDEPHKTICGRFMGRPGDERGERLPIIRAVDDYAARECGQCAGVSYGESRPNPTNS